MAVGAVLQIGCVGASRQTGLPSLSLSLVGVKQTGTTVGSLQTGADSFGMLISVGFLVGNE